MVQAHPARFASLLSAYLFEAWADGVDLVDDVFHAMDAIPGASIRLPGIGSKRERPGAAACPSYLR